MSWLGEAIVGGVATEALGPVPTALLFARRPHSDSGFAKRILVASDGLEDSEKLVARACQVAEAQHADVVLLHAIDGERRMHTDRVREQARTIEAASGCSCEVRIQEGPTWDVISSAAEEARASLIIMGTRRLSGIRAIGSVSRRVVHDASCSVLLIPPDGRG
jgi:nucleotide-binding universal stress UspA family protein